jgi:hypothetical protein
MIDQIVFTANAEEIVEGSRLNVTAKFRDQSARTDATPTTVHWGLRDPANCRTIQEMTSVTPGTSVTLVTTATQNTCQYCDGREYREVTVIVDRGLATQFVATHLYSIQNIGAIRP